MFLLDVLNVVLDLVDVFANLFDLLEELVHLPAVHVDGEVVSATVFVIVERLQRANKTNPSEI